jgi:hypothetical protein
VIKKKLIGANGYSPACYALWNQPNVAGAVAGPVTITLATTFQDHFGNGLLPGDNGQGSYAVQVTSNQACLDSVINKTSSGFNVVLTPIPSTATLAAGAFDVLVHS